MFEVSPSVFFSFLLQNYKQCLLGFVIVVVSRVLGGFGGKLLFKFLGGLGCFGFSKYPLVS